jgi:hypothetical protein
MKKSLLFPIVILSLFLSINSYAGPRQVLLEFCTGTWCPWCPCGDNAAEQILAAHPNTIVLAYHGAGSDPWQNFDGNSVRGLLGFAAYPTATIDRMNHPGNPGQGFPYVTYEQWAGLVNARYSASANSDVNIVVSNKSYNAGTRQLTANISATALQNLSGQYKVSVILTEDNLVYNQSNNNVCIPGSANYVHKWTVRKMVNGPSGENLNTGAWNQNQTLNVPVSVTLDNTWLEQNCNMIVIVYKENATGLYVSTVEQAAQEPVTTATGISNNNTGVPSEFSLSQNYPNPFNPETSIKFSVPKDGNVSLKFYDILGNEVAVYMDGFLKAGSYNASFDGSKLSSGIYFYTLAGDGYKETKKMMLTK